MAGSSKPLKACMTEPGESDRRKGMEHNYTNNRALGGPATKRNEERKKKKKTLYKEGNSSHLSFR